jgi:hypothetical protein
MRSTGMLFTSALACLLAASLLRAEEVTMRPGEYEMTTEMQMAGGRQPMPPTTFRHCFSADDVKDWNRVIRENPHKSSNCQIQDMKTTGSHASWTMTCSSGAKATAQAERSTDGYDITMNMEMPGQSGRNKVKVHTVAKRLGDCAK